MFLYLLLIYKAQSTFSKLFNLLIVTNPYDILMRFYITIGILINLIYEKPFFGYGFGVSSISLSELRYIIGFSPAHAHNILLQSLFCLGITGTTIVLLIIYKIFSFYKKTSDPIFLIILFFILIRGTTESSFMTGSVNFSWLLVCFSFLIYTNKEVN